MILEEGGQGGYGLQGYLAHKKTPPLRTLHGNLAHKTPHPPRGHHDALGMHVGLRKGPTRTQFLMREVPIQQAFACGPMLVLRGDGLFMGDVPLWDSGVRVES